MNRISHKILIIIIVILVVSNLTMLGLFLRRESTSKKTGRGNRSPVEYVTRELDLNKEQSAQFAKLWEENNERNKPLYDSLRLHRESLYQYLNVNPQPDSTIITVTDRIAGFEKQLALNNYAHFRKLSAICSAEQQVKLDTMLKKMGNKRAVRRSQ